VGLFESGASQAAHSEPLFISGLALQFIFGVHIRMPAELKCVDDEVRYNLVSSASVTTARGCAREGVPVVLKEAQLAVKEKILRRC
jgi:hypothetical protein